MNIIRSSLFVISLSGLAVSCYFNFRIIDIEIINILTNSGVGASKKNQNEISIFDLFSLSFIFKYISIILLMYFSMQCGFVGYNFNKLRE